MQKAYPEDRFPAPKVRLGRKAGRSIPQPQDVAEIVVQTGVSEQRSATWGVHQQEEQS